jgi:hypothetical protein
MFVLILQDTVNPECIFILKCVMETVILKSAAEGLFSVINYIYIYIYIYIFFQAYKGDGIFFKQACDRWA